MPSNVNKILATLPTLSKTDLAAVRGAADALLGPQAAPNDGAATPVYDAINHALRLNVPFDKFSATSTYKPYERGVAAITQFIAEVFPQVCDSKIAYSGMLSLMVGCLIDDLKERKVPLSLGTICNNLERTPEAFRAAFPDYIEGGLSHLILNYVTKGRT